MKNKTVLITGASRGIGKAIAHTFANAGYNTAINYFSSQSKAEELASELTGKGLRAICVKADVSCRSQVEEMYNKIRFVYGGVDVLINNAGIAQQTLFTDISPAEWDRMFDVNVKGMFNCTQAVIKDMISKKYGKIINISSIWGISGSSCEVAYSASKAAVIGFTKALAKEMGPSGICVNCIAPGVVDTDMNEGISKETLSELINSTPLLQLGSPQDIANLALFLASEKADFITGQVICADGGFAV